MIFGLEGARARAPIANDGWSSVRGFQVLPASRVSQTPPWAAAIYQWLELEGSTATSAMRPLTGAAGVVSPLAIGAGPMLTHLVPWTVPGRAAFCRLRLASPLVFKSSLI